MMQHCRHCTNLRYRLVLHQPTIKSLAPTLYVSVLYQPLPISPAPTTTYLSVLYQPLPISPVPITTYQSCTNHYLPISLANHYLCNKPLPISPVPTTTYLSVLYQTTNSPVPNHYLSVLYQPLLLISSVPVHYLFAHRQSYGRKGRDFADC